MSRKYGSIERIYKVRKDQKQLLLSTCGNLRYCFSLMFDSYVSSWKGYFNFGFSFFGHHHEQRARAVYAALMRATTLEQAEAILLNQLHMFRNRIGSNLCESLLDKRWSDIAQLRHTTLGGYYHVVDTLFFEIRKYIDRPAIGVAFHSSNGHIIQSQDNQFLTPAADGLTSTNGHYLTRDNQ